MMEVENSKRILFLGTRDAGVLDVIKGLTGSAPTPDESGSIAGLIHELRLQTVYYSAKIPIWVDEVTDLESWQTEFLKPEAKEVVDVVGAWVFCFRAEHGVDSVDDEVQKALKCIQAVTEHHGQDYSTESTMLAVAVPVGKWPAVSESEVTQEEEEEQCMNFGFEYINYGATGRNELGERLGLERLREVLEAVEWDAGDGGANEVDLDDLDFDKDGNVDGLSRDEAEMTAEFYRVRAAVNEGEHFDTEAEDPMASSREAAQVEDLDRLMARLLAIKEGSTDIPEAQRKRLAAKAIKQLLQNDRGL